MTCRIDVAEGVSYRFCPDTPPLAADRLRAVIRWIAIDEITTIAPNVDFGIETDVLGLTPRIGRDGVMGLVGNPARLFPGLDAATVDLAYSISAPGYLPRGLHSKLGPVAGFPDAFAPVDAGIVAMHRKPIVIRGRVVRQVGIAPVPLAGVTVNVKGVWSTFPPHDVDPDTVIEAPNVVSLHPGLYADRSAGADGLHRRDLSFAPPLEEKTLVLPAVPGDTQVEISDCVNLLPGRILAFEAGKPDRVEYITVKSIDAASTTDQPCIVTLDHPLSMAHEEGTPCIRATPVAPATYNAFTRAGIIGDRVAFVGALTGVAEGVVVEIGGGTAPVEYQTARLFDTVTDANGFYRLPPISRVASVKLHAMRFDLTTPREPTHSPEYGRYENLVDVIFPPP